MKRLLLAMMLLMGICMGADAQGFLNRLKDKALPNRTGKSGKQSRSDRQ